MVLVEVVVFFVTLILAMKVVVEVVWGDIIGVASIAEAVVAVVVVVVVDSGVDDGSAVWPYPRVTIVRTCTVAAAAVVVMIVVGPCPIATTTITMQRIRMICGMTPLPLPDGGALVVVVV